MSALASNPGVRALCWEPHTKSGTHKMMLIPCLLYEESRQTAETGFPRASKLVMAGKYT